MRPDQQRVQTLLTDTVTLLCKNGLQYKKELKVQGLLGITLDDDDVFIVHINKIFDDIRGKVSSISSSNAVKVTNIPPSSNYDQDPVSFFDNMRSKVSPESVQVTNIPPSTSISDYENVDGKDYFPEKEEVDTATAQSTGMQLPVIHTLSTGIMSRSVAKKKTTKGIKRPAGAAKRKEQRAVKARLAPSFGSGTGSYGEIKVKDEPPDQVIITPRGAEEDGENDDDSGNEDNNTRQHRLMTNGEHSTTTVYESRPMVAYETYEDCDSPGGTVDSSSAKDNNGDAMDMIECLLYNEGVEQSEGSGPGIYKKVHISGAEDSPLDATQDEDDVLAGCSGWDDKQDLQYMSNGDSSLDATSTNNNTTSSKYDQDPQISLPHNITTKRINGRRLGSSVLVSGYQHAVRKKRTRRPVDSTSKNYYCPFPGCGLKYYRRDNMVRHHLLKHGIAVPPRSKWNDL